MPMLNQDLSQLSVSVDEGYTLRKAWKEAERRAPAVLRKIEREWEDRKLIPVEDQRKARREMIDARRKEREARALALCPDLAEERARKARAAERRPVRLHLTEATFAGKLAALRDREGVPGLRLQRMELEAQLAALDAAMASETED